VLNQTALVCFTATADADGSRVAWCHDPGGDTLSLHQPPKS
jgi:hypothetical protein